jgi:hypothetical protein
MSQAQPFQPNLHPDRDGVPAADLGPGAPGTAPGFGVEGEDPDVVAGQASHAEDADDEDGHPAS